MRCDMHLHTLYSERCGYMRPKRLIEHAIKKRLDGIAVTDHNTIVGALETSEIVGDTMALMVIIGEEISTDRGEVLAYFINKEIAPGQFEDVINAIKRAGGISAIPHPFDRIRKRFIGLESALSKVDAIEALNSRCLFNKKAQILCQNCNKPLVGGSDAHFYGEIGHAWTEFSGAPRECILEGRTHIGGGISNPAYLALTKGLKLWRGTIDGY
jgi:predicted metal-dependent phosphoesterase TrpH